MQPRNSAVVRLEFLRLLLPEIGERNIDHWFSKTLIQQAENRIQITVATPFILTWMQRRFGKAVSDCAQRLLETTACEVEWLLDASLEIPQDYSKPVRESDPTPNGSRSRNYHSESPQNSANDQSQETDRVLTRQTKTEPRTASTSPLQRTAPTTQSARATGTQTGAVGRDGRRFASLDDFVVGNCNELAHTAARHFAGGSVQFDVLYLHGSIGIGKTHLAEGIYRQVRSTSPNKQVMFLTSEAFTNQFTHALRTQALAGFRQRFRSVDVLIVDDLEFLEGKPAIQEEFLHTIKQLLSHGRKVVVTGSVHPRLLSKSSDELVSRLLSGLVCRIENPDPETRRRLVHAKAVEQKLSLDDDVLDNIARRFTRSVREIEGAINSLQAWHLMTLRVPTLNAARKLLSDLERDSVRVVKLPQIEKAVCHLFGLHDTDLRSDKRTRAVSQPRMLAMYLARKYTQSAYKEIGAYFGGRNHSTVISAEKKVAAWLASESELSLGGRSMNLTDVIETIEQHIQAS